jgi:hypothetical protein
MTTAEPRAAERDDLPALSGWAKILQRRLRHRGTDFIVVLHGPGVRDIHPLAKRRHGTIRDFLADQRLIAALECTGRALLPPDLAALSSDEIGWRLQELRAALGR